MRRVLELLASLKAALHSDKAEHMGILQSPDEFNAAIQLEQARIDRNEHPFSLVVFETITPEDGVVETRWLVPLVRKLSDRIRSTDEIGWFDDSRIGVLLPYTSRGGARKFVDDVVGAAGRLQLDDGTVAVNSTIYSYPRDWQQDSNDDDSGQLLFADICDNWVSAERGDSSGIVRDNLDSVCTAEREYSTLVLERPGSDPLPTWKRVMDVLGSLSGLALAAPFFLVHAVVLKIVSPGPVFFRQRRIGYLGRPFTMWKLRTMDVSVDTSVHQEHVAHLINGANSGGTGRPMVKLDDDPHIIPGGKLLRKLCLDEVPQLINVLRGEMSLVGPRPPLEYEVDEFLDWQHRRFEAVPGMTGLWQVSGKNRLSFSQMIRLDIQYSMRKTLLLDLMILLKTPLAIAGQIKDSLALPRKGEMAMEGRHV